MVIGLLMHMSNLSPTTPLLGVPPYHSLIVTLAQEEGSGG